MQSPTIDGDQFISGHQSSVPGRAVEGGTTHHQPTVAIGKSEPVVGMPKRYGIKPGTNQGKTVMQRQRIRGVQPMLQILSQLRFDGLKPPGDISTVKASTTGAMGLPETTQ